MEVEMPDDASKRGAISGATVFLLGFLFTALRIGPTSGEASGPPIVTRAVAAFTVFLDSHVLPVVPELPRTSVSFDPDPVVWGLVLGGLTAAGFWTAYGSSGRSGFRKGAMIINGYVPMAALGAAVVMIGQLFDFDSVSLALLHSVIAAGIVYPVAAGAVGGFLAAEYEHRTRRDSDNESQEDRNRSGETDTFRR